MKYPNEKYGMTKKEYALHILAKITEYLTYLMFFKVFGWRLDRIVCAFSLFTASYVILNWKTIFSLFGDCFGVLDAVLNPKEDECMLNRGKLFKKTDFKTLLLNLIWFLSFFAYWIVCF